ncbi:hypothetical protein [Taklimakanibacter lacteus]|uniref:hypothetical protein n=1 Tax=Taklimakanibacter lacteus TaxID=2268456 RepID=UPI000E674A5B
MTTAQSITVPGASAMLYRDGPAHDGRETAAIGKFSCDTAEAGQHLLDQAVAQLRAEAFGAVIGPMDGDTWHSYRLVSESDGTPPFLLEPTSLPQDRQAFISAGFMPISDYVSARTAITPAILCQAPFALPGLTVTAWDGKNAEGLIGPLFELSGAAFARNAYYKPLDLEGFRALYEPVIPRIDPRHVMFARDDSGKLVGFIFSIPNWLEGPKPTTLIIKTYATTVRGGGRMLLDLAHHKAAELGFTHAIHALMHNDNISRNASAKHGGKVFRSYQLMGRLLD